MKFTTNNEWIPIINWYELTEEEKKEFDYIDDMDEHAFFRFNGYVYALSEFMSCHRMSDFNGWHAYLSDSYFSGMVIRINYEADEVQVAIYTC